MTENFNVVRECRRLETNMNVCPVDNNLQIRQQEVEIFPMI